MLLHGYKTCSKCKEELPETTEYYYKQYDSFRPDCKSCNNTQTKEYHKRNAEELKAKRRKDSYIYRRFVYDLARTCGITEEYYRSLMDNQKGCCEICGSSLVNPEYNRGDSNIGHNHDTGEVRGLLCTDCNQGLGHYHDSVHLLESAVIYLLKRGG